MMYYYRLAPSLLRPLRRFVGSMVGMQQAHPIRAILQLNREYLRTMALDAIRIGHFPGQLPGIRIQRSRYPK